MSMPDKRRIMCFGDSLTWGWVPTRDGPPTQRYRFEERWPGAMLGALGGSYEVIEEALSARTTDLDDPSDSRLNGASYLPSAIASHLPLDRVIIMLGTNDTKVYFKRSPFDIANAISRLISLVASSRGGIGSIYPAPQPVLVAPPPLEQLNHPWQQAKFDGARQKTVEMAGLYAKLADFFKIPFLNAGDFIRTDGQDGIHLTAQNNIDLGLAIADVVRTTFDNDSKP